jgi:HSP20 family protein
MEAGFLSGNLLLFVCARIQRIEPPRAVLSRDREAAKYQMTKRTQASPLLPWQPPADIHRTRDGWLLKFDLAGVPTEDVTVSVRGRRVSVTGVRRDSFLEEGSSYYSMEICYNRFERSVEMPVDLESAHVTIAARDGLLLVRMITEGNQHV